MNTKHEIQSYLEEYLRKLGLTLQKFEYYQKSKLYTYSDNEVVTVLPNNQFRFSQFIINHSLVDTKKVALVFTNQANNDAMRYAIQGDGTIDTAYFPSILYSSFSVDIPSGDANINATWNFYVLEKGFHIYAI